MRAFMNVVQRVVESDVSLLILGETGVGKERLARAIHAEGPRYAGPFIAVNCGALPESLLESELFGHEKGSFTGATRSRRGCFEMAHKGTVFLDEIGEIESHLQVKLLRVLQDREVQRVGGEAPVKVDVRIMAATNHNLEEDIQRGVFRKDLYYRLSVVSLTVPPLRERLEDIPEVVSRYLNYFYSRIERDVTGIQPDALAALMRYSWPGNVRELINVIERAVILCEGHEIKLVDLPETVSGAVRDQLPDGEGFRIKDIREEDLLAMPLRDAKRQVSDLFEKHYLGALLRETNGRIGETARRAGIQPRSLFDKMKQLGLQKEQFRAAHRR
jgi:DNA-binding NtrC family response regulator